MNVDNSPRAPLIAAGVTAAEVWLLIKIGTRDSYRRTSTCVLAAVLGMIALIFIGISLKFFAQIMSKDHSARAGPAEA